MKFDTIAAISTPLGEAGLAVVRISGPDALVVAERCFQPMGKKSARPSAAASHTLHYGKILKGEKLIDEVMLAVLRAPRTFTREDMVEISCHGGVLPTKLVLDAVLQSGARLAEPGEFTKRAFLNGRIDLAQAEAVVDVIQARTELALAAANEQLAGKLSRRIEQLRDELMKTLAHLEAHIDFPEEDIAPETRAQLLRRLDSAVEFIDGLLRNAREGQILRRGIRAAIIGRPNVGKSCLLNQLVGHERAIVSPIAGTTRDTIEETVNVRGLPVVLIDTAGLRDGGDTLEMEGIRRSRETLKKAELILQVLDRSQPFSPEDAHYLEEAKGKKQILVCNKSDLPRRLQLPAGVNARVLEVSSLTGEGLEELKDAIRELAVGGEIGGEMLEAMINSRHSRALERAREAIARAVAALAAEESLEFGALELRIATQAVGEIVGKTTTEDLLDSIFSQFCIGK